MHPNEGFQGNKWNATQISAQHDFSHMFTIVMHESLVGYEYKQYQWRRAMKYQSAFGGYGTIGNSIF